MIHFIVAIQQAIKTQKKMQNRSGDQQKQAPLQETKSAPAASVPSAKRDGETVIHKEPFWKRWFRSRR